MKALSIRQPWAWLIVNGYKDIENRSWPTSYRGPVLIHAAKAMTQAEYQDALVVADSLGVSLPDPTALDRGGIVGIASVAGCSTASASPWFFGKFGFELVGARPLPFLSCKGRLGIFDADHPEVDRHD